MKYISIFIIKLFVLLLFSSNAFTATDFYILPNDSSTKIDCDFLEIINNQALCKANNLLITYEIVNVKLIEVVRDGTSQHFHNFTQETIIKIHELNSNKLATKKAKDNNKNKLDFISDFAPSLINNFKINSGGNSLNTILAISGLIIFLIGSISFLIATFRAGILWGLSCMFVPLVSFVFLLAHWKTVAKPFLLSILGIAILFLNTIFSPTVGTSRGISQFNSGAYRVNTINNNVKFQCSGKIYCSQMSSCSEATFYLRNCPSTKIDGNNDGIPCEKQWCGN